jgi:hypothetical protein
MVNALNEVPSVKGTELDGLRTVERATSAFPDSAIPSPVLERSTSYELSAAKESTTGREKG